MNKKIIYFAAWMITLSMLCLTGCGNKYTTVADSIDNNDGEEYTEISKLNIKAKNSDSKEAVGYCAVMIPKDYKESDTTKGLYVSSLYPLDASNIYYTIEDADALGFVNDDLNKDSYEKAVEGAYKAIDDPIDLVVDEFSKESMSGVPCFKIRSHYTVDGEELQQLVFIIAAEKTYVVTYTQMSDDELLADFVSDDEMVKLVREKSQA